MAVLAVLLTIGVVAVLYDQNGWHFPGDALDGAPSGIVTAANRLAPLVIVSITAMVILVEGGAMVSEAFLKRRYEKGVEDTQAKWEKWLAEKEAAEKEGRTFSKPPPGGRR